MALVYGLVTYHDDWVLSREWLMAKCPGVADARYTSMAVRGTEAILKEGKDERGKRGIWANRRYLITDRPGRASDSWILRIQQAHTLAFTSESDSRRDARIHATNCYNAMLGIMLLLYTTRHSPK
jgi:hypothetical protein